MWVNEMHDQFVSNSTETLIFDVHLDKNGIVPLEKVTGLANQVL